MRVTKIDLDLILILYSNIERLHISAPEDYVEYKQSRTDWQTLQYNAEDMLYATIN